VRLSGFDWLLVDLEHGAGGEEGLADQLLAGAATASRSSRAPSRRSAFASVTCSTSGRGRHVSPIGDAGGGSRRVSAPLVSAARDRGIAGYNRARRFGGDGLTGDEVNEGILAVVQVESVTALENLDEIAALDGVDALFIGPADLSAALGVAGQLEHPVFQDALDKVVAAATRNDVAAGIFVGDPTQVPTYRNGDFASSP